MDALRRLYRWLVRRLPPRLAWAIWRAALLAAAPRRARVEGPVIERARVAWGVSEGDLAAIVDELARDAPEPAVLLVISDCDAVHVAAARGVRLEHLPARAAWSRLSSDRDYDAFIERRMRSILASYRIDSLELGGDAPEPMRRVAEAPPGSGPSSTGI